MTVQRKALKSYEKATAKQREMGKLTPEILRLFPGWRASTLKCALAQRV